MPIPALQNNKSILPSIAKMSFTTSFNRVIIAIEKEYKLPVVFVGTGEGVDDIEDFNPKSFVSELF